MNNAIDNVALFILVFGWPFCAGFLFGQWVEKKCSKPTTKVEGRADE